MMANIIEQLNKAICPVLTIGSRNIVTLSAVLVWTGRLFFFCGDCSKKDLLLEDVYGQRSIKKNARGLTMLKETLPMVL